MIWDRLGLYLGGFGRGLGRDLEPLGASWVVFGALFSMLVFGMVVKGAFGGYWARFWVDFGGLGRILLLSLAVSCFLLLSLAFSCLLLLALALSCFLLLFLDFSCSRLIYKDSSCAFRSIATQVSHKQAWRIAMEAI